MSETVRSRWTPADESRLAELIERKRRITDENMGPVTSLVTSFECEVLRSPIQCGGDLYPMLRSFLIDHADYVRDALEPFDSGVRTVYPLENTHGK